MSLDTLTPPGLNSNPENQINPPMLDYVDETKVEELLSEGSSAKSIIKILNLNDEIDQSLYVQRLRTAIDLYIVFPFSIIIFSMLELSGSKYGLEKKFEYILGLVACTVLSTAISTELIRIEKTLHDGGLLNEVKTFVYPLFPIIAAMLHYMHYLDLL